MSWFDHKIAINGLFAFFRENGASASDFGTRVCQTFEAITFAQMIKWYRNNGWETKIINPTGRNTGFKLKFSTRGDTANYTYVECSNPDRSEVVQIRHQIRVETFHNFKRRKKINPANIVCDVAVLKDDCYDFIRGSMHVQNDNLITFAEAKHMDAYAELLAGFLGLVFEMQPWRLLNDRGKKKIAYSHHPKPFLNLSGRCLRTAEGIKATIVRRKFDIAIHDVNEPFIPNETPPSPPHV
jgi:hypothetical protein